MPAEAATLKKPPPPMASASGDSDCSTVPCTVLVKSGRARTEPGACRLLFDCVMYDTKLVSVRLKPTVWLLAMLSDTWPSARLWEERPLIAMVSEPNRDMAAGTPVAGWRDGGWSCTRRASPRGAGAGPGLPGGRQIVPPIRRGLPGEGPPGLARAVQGAAASTGRNAAWTPPPPPPRHR